MPRNIKQIKNWNDNPQKDRISNVVKIDFNFPCTWTILDIKDLMQILSEWIKGEELKYPLDRDVGQHIGPLRGRWMLFEEIKKVFGENTIAREEEKQMENTDLNSWDNFTGSNFLKAEDVKDIEKKYIVKGVEMDKENERPLLILECDGVSSKFGLNVTNSNFLKNEGVKSPVEVVGRMIKFNIVKAFSPTAKKEVDSLRIRTLE